MSPGEGRKPAVFVFEREYAKHREFFEAMKLKLINAGYYITEKLINAIEFGAPQDRDRIILIGFQRSVLGDYGFKLNGSPIIKNFNWEKNTLFKADEVFGMKWPALEKFKQNGIRPSPINVPIELTVEYWFKKNDVDRHANAERRTAATGV